MYWHQTVSMQAFFFQIDYFEGQSDPTESLKNADLFWSKIIQTEQIE